MNGSGILGGISKIFTGLYNTLFQVESGEILRAIEHIETNSPLGNATLLSGDKEILNTLTGTPQDFIIAWDGINYQNQEIIPSGSINFSEKARENETMTTILNWIRVLMGFSIITIIIQEYYFTFLKLFGVGVSVYEQNEEERARLEDEFGTHVYDTQVRDITTNKVLKNYRTFRRRRR